jgi:ABC-2 type transport system permease protein
VIDYLIKAIAFFAKEFHDIRRQPRLLISLVGGPLLVLAAFGATFRSANPFVSTVLVWPENGIPGVSQEQAANFIGKNFYLVKVTTDENEAMQMLDRGEVDVVQIVPAVGATPGENATRPELRVLSRAINPNAEAWTRSLAFGEMNFINQQLLTQEAKLAQEKAQGVAGSLSNAQQQFEQLRQNLNSAKIDQAAEGIDKLRNLLVELLAFLPPESLAQANLSPELSQLYRNIEILSDDLEELEHVLQEGDLASQLERLTSTIDEIGTLRVTIDMFAASPTENIITPIQETYTNLRGSAYSLVIFYAPAVLALLVQQLAITLASLGLVRERQMGSFEMFRVSPVKFSQILLGKSTAYILIVTIGGLILTAVLALLKVPLPALPGQYLLLLILLSTAAVGIGFLISSVSRTDSQAIQLTMLVLLLSIFFTGFFLPITGFMWPAWIIALFIPMTHAIEGFQNIMLAGTPAGSGVWLGLGLIILLSFGLVSLIMRRQYRKVLN